MKVAIIDADLVGRKRHRFPNLACMKLSGYHKDHGDDVTLKTNYNDLEQYDTVYISKVFTDTAVPDAVLSLPNVSYGGTGFYYDKAPKLPDEVEHHTPDYHLYDDWVAAELEAGEKPLNFQYYTDYSIGFMTRGCFRQCKFCVNQNYKRAEKHSPLSEFLDLARPKICLLDDNFLSHPAWKEMLTGLQATKKPFIFKQGLDERILTPEKCELLFKSNYAGDFGFAFDNVAERDIVEEKLQLMRQYTNAVPKFFCFCGFDRADNWDTDFWRQDIFDLLARIEVMMRYHCLPYIMRFNRYEESPYRGVYISIARWCNQPSFYKKKSLREFAELNGKGSACYRYLREFEEKFPEVSYFYDMKYDSFDGRGNEITLYEKRSA